MRSILLVQAVTISLGWASASAAQSARFREVVLDHAQRDPGVALEQPAPPIEIWPTTIEEAAKDADLIVEGTLVRQKSYFTTSDDFVRTDFAITDAAVLAGRVDVLSSRTPGASQPLILTAFGGEATVDGVVVRATDWNRGPIISGARYLMLLKRSSLPGPGRYEVHHAGIFEIGGSTVRPVMKKGDHLFNGTVDQNLTDLRSRIAAAVGVQK